MTGLSLKKKILSMMRKVEEYFGNSLEHVEAEMTSEQETTMLMIELRGKAAETAEAQKLRKEELELALKGDSQVMYCYVVINNFIQFSNLLFS